MTNDPTWVILRMNSGVRPGRIGDLPPSLRLRCLVAWFGGQPLGRVAVEPGAGT